MNKIDISRLLAYQPLYIKACWGSDDGLIAFYCTDETLEDDKLKDVITVRSWQYNIRGYDMIDQTDDPKFAHLPQLKNEADCIATLYRFESGTKILVPIDWFEN